MRFLTLLILKSHVSKVQQVINWTFQKSTNTTPFELLVGYKIKLKNNVKITDFLNTKT